MASESFVLSEQVDVLFGATEIHSAPESDKNRLPQVENKD
jgi:hypothetical protein